MGGGLERRCVGRVCGADGAVRRTGNSLIIPAAVLRIHLTFQADI